LNVQFFVLQKSSYKITYYWSIFQSIIETSDAFLLSHRKNHFILIPKRAFLNAEKIQEFQEMLKQQTGKPILVTK